MITAKEINNKRFEQAKQGYKPDEVDDFLRDIAIQINAMQQENDDIQKKIALLVESVREYKKDEDALKDALLGAQKQGRAVIAEAKDTAKEIINDAHQKSDVIIQRTKVLIDNEKQTLARMQQEVTDFKTNLLNMYKAHLEQITSMPEYDVEEEVEPAAEEIQEEVVENADEVTFVPSEEVSETVNEEAVEDVSSEAPADKSSEAFPNKTASKNKYSDLKFGHKN